MLLLRTDHSGCFRPLSSVKKAPDQNHMAKDRDFIFFSHTADVKFRAYGGTLEEVFCNAGYALVSLMWEKERIARKIKRPVAIESGDDKQLLVIFLEEILYLMDSRSFLLHSIEALRIRNRGGRYSLKGFFWGDTYKNGYETFGEVKAVTYNEMKIEWKERFVVQVVVDV